MRHRARVHDRGGRVAIFVAEIGADQLAFLIADRSAVEIEQRLDLVIARHEHAPRLPVARHWQTRRSEEHTSELQSLMRISYAVFCLKKKSQMLIAGWSVACIALRDEYRRTVPHRQSPRQGMELTI